MSGRNVLKLDIESLTDFQKELYGKAYDVKNIDQKVLSRFSCNIEKYGWCVHTKAKMTQSAEEGEVIYTASKKFDVLFKTEAHINLFPIKVKEKFKSRIEICYPHNVGHNICYQGELKIDDDHHQTIDSVWMDIHSQFFMDSGVGKRDHYNRMIGNVPALEEWNTELPGLKLIVPQPFYYSRNSRVGLVMLQSSMNTVTHHYKIRNKIAEILRMRVKINTDSDEVIWREIPCKLQYLDIPGRAKEIPIPELWGRYAIMSEEERNWWKHDENGNPTKRLVYTEDIVMATSNNPTALNSTDVISLHCKSPCKSIFWVAQDIRSVENRNFSNYTTNSDNLFGGWNPCSEVEFKYGGAHRIDKLSYEHFELSEIWDFFPSAPIEPGYNAYTFGFQPGTLNADTAIVLEPLNASINIKLGDTDPFKTIEEEEEEYDENGELIPIEALEDIDSVDEQKNRYIIHVRALVYKKLFMSWNEKTKSMKYLIQDDATNKN